MRCVRQVRAGGERGGGVQRATAARRRRGLRATSKVRRRDRQSAAGTTSVHRRRRQDRRHHPTNCEPHRTISRTALVTFRVSRRRREMYCGHARLCVCVTVRGRTPTLLHGPGCNLVEW